MGRTKTESLSITIPATSSSSTMSTTLETPSGVIKADLLIPGRGDPIEKGAIAYAGGRILWVGRQSHLPKEYASYNTKEVPVLLPGFWDCHVHYLGSRSYNTEDLYKEPKALAGARGARDVFETLNGGYTSVRELGGYGILLDKAISEGYLIGPKIYSSVSVISQTGGHADAHDVDIHHFREACGRGFFFEICDGVPECLRAVRLQLRQGAKLIKICASGGICTEVDDPQHQQFSDEEMIAMVEEARRADRIVAAHCHGKAGIMAALRVGCKTIEHGTYLDDESIEKMKEADAILIPTRHVQQSGLLFKDGWSERSYAKLKAVAVIHAAAYKAAVKAGVKIALGSDIGFSIQGTPFSHGTNAWEIKYAVDAGLTPLQAIEAATANGPSTLGPQAPLSGQLKEGYDADFIALTANPLDNIDIVTDANNITHVWRGGKLFKSPN